MDPRKYALYGGIVMIVLGVLALIMPGPADGLPLLAIESSYGRFLGVIPMNIVNKLALIVFGLAGIGASMAKFTALPMSIRYSRMVAFAMALLTVLGLIPATNTLFGYWPLFSGNVVLYALVAVVSAYFGFALTSKVPDSGPAKTTFSGPLHN